jgi:hypothetical protein
MPRFEADNRWCIDRLSPDGSRWPNRRFFTEPERQIHASSPHDHRHFNAITGYGFSNAVAG